VKVFLVAGEPSGDRLGGALMTGLAELELGVRFVGIGGIEMESRGLASLFPMEELSVIGLDVLPRYFALKRRIRETAAAILEASPDVVVTIDAPEFCLRVLKIVRAKRPDLPTVHYVAPSVWAWRPGRGERMARVVDHVLALLPFEPPYMHAAGMSCDFVGHPVVAEPVATEAEAHAFRAEHGIGDALMILALPGSRRGEIDRLAPRFGATLAHVLERHPEARVVVPAVAAQAQRLRALIADWPGAPVLLDQSRDPPEVKRAAFRAADVALAASGTVSVELAANGVPMLIAYDFNPVTRMLIRRLALVDTATLVNLVSDTRAVPECLLENCRPAVMVPALLRVIEQPEARAAQRAAMEATMDRLGRGGAHPGRRAARSVCDFLTRHRAAVARELLPVTASGPGSDAGSAHQGQ
jgi:lipid-A-disaccharide synthase